MIGLIGMYQRPYALSPFADSAESITLRISVPAVKPIWSLAPSVGVPSIMACEKTMSSDRKQISPLRAWLRKRENEMAALLAELVSIRTENPPGRNCRSCADFLESRLREFGLECERFQGPGKPTDGDETPVSLLASYGRGDRAIYFHGHYDVVPAQSPEQFRAFRREHLLFGRGSCDMKGGLVAMLYAIRALAERGAELRGKVGLTFVPDEETGGKRGSAWLAHQRLLGKGGIGMLTAEPTGGVVWNANRGAISLRVEVFGKSAHVGLQHHGENAFELAHRVVRQLLKLKCKLEERRTNFNVDTERARHSILMLGGQSGSGENFNVVPDKCWFTLDRRINPEEDLELEKTRLLCVLERCKHDGIPLKWKILQEGRSAACRQDEMLGQALARSVEYVTGGPPRFEMCPGLLDIRFYAAQGMPAYAYGPGLLSVAHGPNEYVDLRKVGDCAAIYALTAMEMLKA
jgi:succinyl-diaminopimelate desuccinylase